MTLTPARTRTFFVTVMIAAGLIAAYSLISDDSISEEESERAATSPLDASRSAPWKQPLPHREGVLASLDDYRYRLGSWLSEEPLGQGSERHRIRIDYELTLDSRLLKALSHNVFEDGRVRLYLEENLFLNARRPSVVPAYLFFDDGLYADATWIDDGDGIQRLDCDLYWPDGRTGRVRDLFMRVGADTIRWLSYYERDGEMPSEPDADLTMVRGR